MSELTCRHFICPPRIRGHLTFLLWEIIYIRVVPREEYKDPWRGPKRGFKGRREVSNKVCPKEVSNKVCPKEGPIGAQEGGAHEVVSKDRNPNKIELRKPKEVPGGVPRGGDPQGDYEKLVKHQNLKFGHVKCPSDIGNEKHWTCLVPPRDRGDCENWTQNSSAADIWNVRMSFWTFDILNVSFSFVHWIFEISACPFGHLTSEISKNMSAGPRFPSVLIIESFFLTKYFYIIWK